MKLTSLLPFRASKNRLFLIGIALGIASQRIPEIKAFTDYILRYTGDFLTAESLLFIFQKYKRFFFFSDSGPLFREGCELITALIQLAFQTIMA